MSNNNNSLEIQNLKEINEQFKNQTNKLLQTNKLGNKDFYQTLNNTVILYYNLVEKFGFDLVNEVIDGTKERMMNTAVNKNKEEKIPTTFYVLLLIGIVLFFQDDVESNKHMIPKLSDILFNMLEENAITAIIYLISKQDFESFESLGKSSNFSVYKFPDYNAQNIVNSVLIVNKHNGKKYQTTVMPFGMLTNLQKLLAPTLPPSDILGDFVNNRQVYSISNTGVLNYLKQKLEEESFGRPAKRSRIGKGGKPKTRKNKKTTKNKKTMKKRKKSKRGASVPMRYVPRSLSEKNKATQRAELKKSRKAYKQKNGKGKSKSKSKNKYYTRKKMSSFQSKVSPHVIKARNVYGIEKITPSAELAKATKCSRATLRRIEQKGLGAYYS